MRPLPAHSLAAAVALAFFVFAMKRKPLIILLAIGTGFILGMRWLCRRHPLVVIVGFLRGFFGARR